MKSKLFPPTRFSVLALVVIALCALTGLVLAQRKPRDYTQGPPREITQGPPKGDYQLTRPSLTGEAAALKALCDNWTVPNKNTPSVMTKNAPSVELNSSIQKLCTPIGTPTQMSNFTCATKTGNVTGECANSSGEVKSSGKSSCKDLETLCLLGGTWSVS